MSPVSISPSVPESSSLRSAFTGDLTVAFGTGQPSAGRVAAVPWTSLAVDPEWQLWQQSSGLDWKGVPLTQIRTPGWQIWLLGEMYGQQGAGHAPDHFLAEIIRGERPASQLNGHLLLYAWDESQRHWHVWTDRFGSLHAYQARSGDSTALGTSFRTVASLASRRQLDWRALAGFFGFGFFPGDRTYYEDVRILRPATHYVFGAKGEELKAERYWDWRHEPDRKRSYEDTVAQFGELFQEVMAEMMEGGSRSSVISNQSSVVSSPGNRVALPISGGLDSRSTVAAVGGQKTEDGRQTGRSPSSVLWSYSYGYGDDSVETRIARQVAEARGLPFTAFTIKPYLFDRLEQVVNAVEGFQDVTQCRQAFLADELANHADYVIAAHWGDVWLDDMRLPSSISNLPSSISDHALGKMAKKGRKWLLENICAPHLGKEQPESLLRGFVEEGMRCVDGIEDPDFRVKAFKTENWSFRWTLASLRMFQAAAFPRLPFYDTRLADFFGTVPTEFVQGRRLQIDYLKRFAPDLARIEWQPYGADLYHYQDSDPLDLPKRAAKKAWRTLTGKKVIERNWEVQFSGEQGEAGLSHWLLRPGLRLHELVAKDKIRTLLDSFRAEPLKDGRGYTVSVLLTFSAWLEH